ncbi:hypothetical protein KIN20_037125 [Parelaphostrongylus tenuis]|uniref:Aminopeptidase n=1 Tax=Parelaphostrongylus tenuis TaxID=148309 RepID=A0AAD5WM74_PARTN|nr:hypothetical protein KIN20_037125 [Parelaphostrongylus tenuis]
MKCTVISSVVFVIEILIFANIGSGTNQFDSNGSVDDSPTAADLLLPTNLVPLHYNLTIKTYLPFYVPFPPSKNLTFDGQVVITIKVLEPDRQIVLNMKDITVAPLECKVVTKSEDVKIEQIREEETLEKISFVLSRTLKRNEQVKLEVTYTGLISNTLSGLYQATYRQADGKTKIAAVTHFEPVGARRMVPCFDEPRYKANWTVTVIHPKGTRAVSNGIKTEEKEETSGDWKVSKFLTTPKMSSYLLAILVSEFDYIEKYTKSGVRFRVWSRPEAVNMTQYALDSGVRCLEFYEDYFGIKYPLKKQDMVALPDFAPGAMENWGLITYRENALLYDENLYGPANKARVAMVVAHELAHQWFGNLVTMEWWDDLWLNEGFATMVEYIGADEISNGQMRMIDYFLLDSFTSGLIADSIASSHPLSFQIDKAAEVLEAFDDISYGKGASVLFMLSALIGEENFKRGVNHYLKKFSYSNARAFDLWSSFDEVVQNLNGPDQQPIKITKFADAWTKQLGYPLVTAESFNATALKITQTRYKLNPKALEPEKYQRPSYGFKWDVPIWYQEGKEEVKLTWLKPDGWTKIIKQLKENHEVFSSRTRNAIINDVFAAAAIGRVEYETAFKLLAYISNEEEYLPWSEAIISIKEVVEKFGNEPESKFAKLYAESLLRKAYYRTDFNYISKRYKDDDLFFEMNRDTEVIGAYCFFGSRNCTKRFAELFDQEVMAKCQKDDVASRCVSIAAPLRANTYCYGVKEGGDVAFEKVMKLFRSENVQLERGRLQRALGCHNNITSLESLLLLALDRNASVIRLQDVAAMFRSVSNNPIGQEFMFDFLIKRWDQIYNSLSNEHVTMSRVISACTKGIRSDQQLEQLKNLQQNGLHADKFGEFDKVIEKTEEKLDWIKKHFQKLALFFESQIKKSR